MRPGEGGLGFACLLWIAEDHATLISTNVCTGRKCLSRDSEDSSFVGAIGNHE